MSIDTTFTSFLSNPNNLLIVNYVAYSNIDSTFEVRCHSVEDYKSINSSFLKEYTSKKRKYLIDKIVGENE
jgi:hypothetical protein